MELINHISCLPLEILEREIIPWLSPPEAASLILAVGRSMFGTARPVIWIRWKHILKRGKPVLTLTLNSRGGAAARIIDELRYTFACNPEDSMYSYIAGACIRQPKWTARNYVLAMSMIARDPSIANRLNWHDLDPDIINHGELMMGIQPSDHSYAHRLYSVYTYPKGLQDDVFVEYMLSSVAVDSALGNYLTGYFEKHPVKEPRTIELLAANKLTIDMKWMLTSMRAYRAAITSGQLWLTRDCWTPKCFTPSRWGLLAADFIPRVEATREYVNWEPSSLLYEYLHLRIRDLVSIVGPRVTFTTLTIYYHSAIYGPAAAIQFRKIVGDMQLYQLASAYQNGYRSCSGRIIPIIAGCSYATASAHIEYQLYHAHTAIRYGNISFFRDILTALRDTITPEQEIDIMKECVTSGAVEFFAVTLELGMTIPPKQLQLALTKCKSQAILELVGLMG
jgi:hypothetical protein